MLRTVLLIGCALSWLAAGCGGAEDDPGAPGNRGPSGGGQAGALTCPERPCPQGFACNERNTCVRAGDNEAPIPNDPNNPPPFPPELGDAADDVRDESGNEGGQSAEDGGAEPSPEEPGAPSSGESGGELDACSALDAEWPPEWAAFEREVVRLVNQNRASGANCGEQRLPPGSEALMMDPMLRCAARLHSSDMALNGAIYHVGPDGRSSSDRISDIGYTGGFPRGENVRMGRNSPDAVVDEWMADLFQCTNLMNPSFNEVGVGFDAGGADFPDLWTIKLARR